MDIRPFQTSDTDDVVILWIKCGLISPTNDAYKDIARKQTEHPELFLVAFLEGCLIATIMAGYEGHRGWINYLAVDPEHRRNSIARTIMQEAELKLKNLGVPKINLQVRESNNQVIKFYQSLGYQVDRVVSLGKRLIKD